MIGGFPKGFCPGAYLTFDFVTYDLHEKTMHLIKSEDDTKLGVQLIHLRADLSFRET